MKKYAWLLSIPLLYVAFWSSACEEKQPELTNCQVLVTVKNKSDKNCKIYREGSHSQETTYPGMITQWTENYNVDGINAPCFQTGNPVIKIVVTYIDYYEVEQLVRKSFDATAMTSYFYFDGTSIKAGQ